MSAGSGIRHSEFNPSKDRSLHFLQIWILPNVYGQAPGYQQKAFGQKQGLTLVVSPDGAEGSLTVKQDARLYQLLLGADNNIDMSVDPARNYYVHVIDGELTTSEAVLEAGDGAHLHSLDRLSLKAGKQPVKALVFDLP